MTRSITRNQQMRDERRERILFHARCLFAVKGLTATKVSDIAAQAGMAQGLFYHYFPAKEAIFTEIIRDAFARMNEAACGLEALPLAPHEKIRLALTTLLRDIAGSEDFAGTVLLIAQAGISDATPAEAQAIMQAESGIPYTMIARIMREGQREGTIKPYDPDELALVFWTLIKGLAIHRATQGKGFTAPDVRMLTGMFLTDESMGDRHG